jgi:hypothetical protein
MANWLKGIFRWFKKPDSLPRTDAPHPAPPAPPAHANLSDKKSTNPFTSEPPATPKPEPERAEHSTVTRFQESSALPPPPPPLFSSTQSVADLTIGFDLGTSCSKVAVGDSMLGSQHGVPFNTRAHGVEKYLFPTRFYEGADGISLSFGPNATLASNLKLRLIEAVENQGDTSGPETDLAIYVALVLKHTLAWYEQHRAGDHRARARCWWLSFGFPAKRVDNNPRLQKAYQRFVGAAIQAVNLGEHVTRELIQRCLARTPLPGDSGQVLSLDRVSFYPEIAAQLAGYVYSRYRTTGPLMLIDVGAGTLDISTLILHQNAHEEVCSFHFCEVAQLGAFRLYEQIHHALAAVSPDAVDTLVSIGSDQDWHVPESPNEYVRAIAVVTNPMKAAFHSTREIFALKCLEKALSNFSAFKQFLDQPFRDADQRPRAFRQNVNIILSGGGSRAIFYRKLFPERLEETVVNSGLTTWKLDPGRRKIDGQGFHPRHLMKPDKFIVSGVESDDFDRLSVAHGLSLSSETLLQITAKEMSDRQWNGR